ncbi:MAG: diacylglycerol kinase family protein [Candidatus Woesearchaeota archaeon]
MTLKAASILNKNAKQLKQSRILEEKSLEWILKGVGARVDTPKSADSVAEVCREYIQEKIDIVIVSGGDGTVQNFLTHNFRELYKKFNTGGMTPIEFGRVLNNMALDPDTGLVLPAAYHRMKGTVNTYGKTLDMRSDIEIMAENLDDALHKYSEYGARAFRRIYVPILMIYDPDNQDIDNVQLMTLYADSMIYNIFEEYYGPKDQGNAVGPLDSLKIIVRAGVSAILDKMLPRDRSVGKIYKNRYIDRIVQESIGEVKADGTTIVGKEYDRNAMAIGTMNANLYGIKPFNKMPRKPKQFNAFFHATAPERKELLNPEDYHFQLLVGNIKLLDVAKRLPNFYLNRSSRIRGVADIMTKRVEINDVEPLRYIGDGGRFLGGRNMVIEIAYLQPFVQLNHRPMQ